MRVTRRKAIAAGGTTLAGLFGLTTLTQQSKATGIKVDEFTIPDLQKNVHDPVNKARARVSGSWSIDAETMPTRVVLRFEAKRRTSSNYQQLAADGRQSGLSKEMTQDYSPTQCAT